jgi:hypothetical protein
MVAHGICAALVDYTETMADLAPSPLPAADGTSDDVAEKVTSAGQLIIENRSDIWYHILNLGTELLCCSKLALIYDLSQEIIILLLRKLPN